MNAKSLPKGLRLAARALPLVLAGLLAGGCFDAPKLEDLWTRIDLLSASLTPSQVVAGGTAIPITVSTRLTYRRIITGYAVAELRASTVPPSAVSIHPNAPRLTMAEGIDQVLPNSVTQGRAIRAVTGWDHLMQEINFSFTGNVPPAGSAAGLYLLCYLGSGVKVELPSGADTIIVTPYPSTTYQILPIGMALTVQ